MEDNGNSRRKFNFYNILFFAIIPIIIVVMLVIKTIYVYETITIIDLEDISSFIIDSNLLDIGIAIIGIAVSVWLGINISNLVDRRQIDELNCRIDGSMKKVDEGRERIKELDAELESINLNTENQFYRTKFLEQLLKTLDLYESSLYLYDLFATDMNADYHGLYDIENIYCSCVHYYESSNWGKSYEYSVRGLEMIKKYTDEKRYKEYYMIRKSDFLFFRNVVLTHNAKLGEFSVVELEESIKLYERMLEITEEQRREEDGKKFIGYIFNTVGYTYDILQIHSKKNGEQEKSQYYSSLAIYNMSKAVEYNDKGRYLRNLGLTYQHSGNLERAKEYYKKAFETDPKDYKAYNNRLSLILRVLDDMLDVNRRFDNKISLAELTDISPKVKALEKELKEINRYRDFAEKANCWFEDLWYNTCKMYMYLYIISEYKQTEYIELAIEFGKKALFLNSNSAGARFWC